MFVTLLTCEKNSISTFGPCIVHACVKISTNCCLTFSRADEDPSFITSKHLRRYSGGDPIDTESSDESDDEGRRDDSSDDDDENDRATSNARQSWCTIS